MNTNTDLYEELLWSWLIRFKTDEVEFQDKHLRSIRCATELWNKLSPAVVNPKIGVYHIQDADMESERELPCNVNSVETPPQLLSPPATPRREGKPQLHYLTEVTAHLSSASSVFAAQQPAPVAGRDQHLSSQTQQEHSSSHNSAEYSYLSPPLTPSPTVQSQAAAEVPPDSYLLEVFEHSIADAALREAKSVFEEARAACAEVANVRGEILTARIDLAAAKAEAKYVRDDAAAAARLEVEAAQVEAELIRAEAMRYARSQLKAARAEARDIRAKAVAFADSGAGVSCVAPRPIRSEGPMSSDPVVTNVRWALRSHTLDVRTSTICCLQQSRGEVESGCSWIYI